MDVRILIIEDDRTAARYVREILKDASSLVDIAHFGEDGIARTKNDFYDLIVLDLSLPDMHGLEVIRRLRAADVITPILILSGDPSTAMLVECLECGADDYVTKTFNASELIARVHALERRGIEAARLTMAARDAAAKLSALTMREREVLDLLVSGLSNKAAAHELGISTRTVEVHRANLMEKLNAASLSDVVRIAVVAAHIKGEATHSASSGNHIGVNSNRRNS